MSRTTPSVKETVRWETPRSAATVRDFSERLVRDRGAALIRLNPREFRVPRGQVGLEVGALAGLRALDEMLTRAGWCS